MKKFLLLSLLIAAVSLSSCKKDDDPDPVSPIVGSWHLMEILITDAPSGYSDIEGVSLSPTYFFIASDIMFLYEDNTFEIKRNFLLETVNTFSGTYVYTNNQLTLDYDQGTIDNETFTMNEFSELEVSVDVTLDFSTQEQEVFVPVETNWIYRRY